MTVAWILSACIGVLMGATWLWFSDDQIVLYVKQKCWYRHHVLVRMLDSDNQIRYTLARPLDGFPQAWQAPVFFSTGIGHVILLREGVVHDQSQSAYVYAWEHVDKDLRVNQALMQPEFQGVEAWQKLSHEQKHGLRRQIIQENYP